ncbi:probable Probable 1,4-beta-D-glucan cellobiohydrolase A [Cephalotrichum gorgonifer]|uniref:Glucanase n=1 Tax=Cephalotrichum gorgonifer TaxID=2041049 RepID=A0AAE8SYC1_9PEZI|nr:probable Probable 1,4-beta-D-glucan cellobiohydrolase A [Cephalotrichum gorgonifer]
MLRSAVISALVASAAAQKVGTSTAEVHPKMSWQKCAEGGSCSKVDGEVVLDANWRWLHEVDGYENCYDGNLWTDKCSTPEDCATKCALDGADYTGTYGASASGDALTLKFVTKGEYGNNIGSRLYMMEDSETYQMFTLLGNEFTFDVDLSKLGCGLNGALYFVSMDADGGMSKDATNEAGAKYGTGYCDAQCPRDLKFINGLGNIEGWNPSDSDANAGVGEMGSCCSEMDIWEANSISTAYTPHPCTTVGQHKCTGDSCGGTYSNDRYGGTCDPDGCDFNSYRQGDKTFYGPGMTIDTNKVFTVVTQFIEEGGKLSAIRRFYVQDGEVIANSESLIDGNPGNELNPEFCEAQKLAFGDDDVFKQKGGFDQFTKAVEGGMVLVMSVWDDHYANMLWLDSTYPTDSGADEVGKARGSCPTDSGVPEEIEVSQASDQVTFSNIKFGPIGSTFDAPAA